MMSTKELRDKIIQKVWNTQDKQLLDYLHSILSTNEGQTTYNLSDFEKKIINESLEDYKKGDTMSNDDVFAKNKKWLEK